MKFKEVDFITSNEGLVRQRIYDGDLQVSEAAQELIRLERCQREEAERRLREEIRRRVAVEMGL